MSVIYLDRYRFGENLSDPKQIASRSCCAWTVGDHVKNSHQTSGQQSGWRSQVLILIQTWRKRWHHRRMLREDLLHQPDSVLADVGYTRNDAEREANTPFWRA
ncbi:MAG: hypothetical protein AAGC70_08335 [Pseudomonadota bacterium]